MSGTVVHIVRGPQAMRALGRRLARSLAPGAVVGLDGPLGAGKTVLVQGMVEGLGGDRRAVTSASFTLSQIYPTEPPLIHVDLYRLDDPLAIHDAGLLEPIDDPDGAIVAVEWFAKLGPLRPRAHVGVRIAFAGARTRRVEIRRPRGSPATPRGGGSRRPPPRARRSAGARPRTAGRG